MNEQMNARQQKAYDLVAHVVLNVFGQNTDEATLREVARRVEKATPKVS